MRGEESLTYPWVPDPDTPWLGEILLGAVGAVHGELPTLRMRPPGGTRRSAGKPPHGVSDASPATQRELINPSALAARASVGFSGAARAVVILVDGLGWHNLSARADLTPFLTREFSWRQARSATPSTTAANVTFLGTGVHPGQTAMAGYTVRNPETGGAMNLISWAGGMDPLLWQRVPTVFERLAADGGVGAHVSTWRFENSGLTQAALRGAHYVAAESFSDRVEATVELMHTSDTAVAYLYWAEIDAVGHQYGWQNSRWDDALRDVDAGIARLVRELPSDTLVVLTADHGMVDVPRGPSALFGGPARIDIAAHSELSRGVDLVAGENRFIQLFSAQPEAVAKRWRAFLGERALVLTRGEAFTAGHFGPVRADVADVIGDVVVALLGDVSVGDSRIMSESMFNLPGLHGSLTDWERAVPLLHLITS